MYKSKAGSRVVYFLEKDAHVSLVDEELFFGLVKCTILMNNCNL